jgi:hypothetical protein
VFFSSPTGELHSLQDQGQPKEGEDYDENYSREDTEKQDVQQYKDKENRSTDVEEREGQKWKIKGGAKIFWPGIEPRTGRRIFNESLPTLVGIVSWGLGCARPTYAGMFKFQHVTK